jgi:hypothetical protein
LNSKGDKHPCMENQSLPLTLYKIETNSHAFSEWF